MRKPFFNNFKGITLTELMIYVAIAGIFVALISGFFVQSIKFYRLTMAKGEVQRDVRVAVDLVNRNLRQGFSDSMLISRFNSSQPPWSMVQFTHINGKEYRYYQLNNSFYAGTRETAGAWADKKIGENLRTLLFAYPSTDDPSIISVSMCFERGTYEKKIKTLQLSVDKVRLMN